MTTGILRTEYEQRFKFNQGIFIDIFPMDAVPDDRTDFQSAMKEAERLKRKYNRLAGIDDRFFIPQKKNLKYHIKNVMHTMIPKKKDSIWDYDKYYKQYEELCCKWNSQNTKMLGLLGMRFSEVNLRYRKDFEEAIEMPFEFMTIPIPKNYDHALKHIFGDYMKFVKGGSLHGGMILDADIPYTEYLKEGSNLNYNSELYYHE